MPTPVGRLAPSPTGVLHLGNARSFLLAWLSIRAQGGRMLLRIEDIDGPRVKPEATAAAIEDLEWLGLDWDDDPWVQSERQSHYDAALKRLMNAGHVYPCICSRKEIEAAASAPHEGASGGDGMVYPGTCRGRFESLDAARSVAPAALRFRVDVASVPFHDGFRGDESGDVRGDFVVMKRDGGPAYQLAVVVDDAASGVTEVLRADDLVPSTPRQLLLYRALGLTPPTFLHVPLVVGEDGLRLAKRHGDTSLHAFREAGVTAQRMVGRLARLSGLRPTDEPVTPRELLEDFDLTRIPRGPVRGDDVSDLRASDH